MTITFEFEKLLKAHFSFLRKQALRLTQNRFDADDLVQETVEKIVRNAEKFMPDSNFKAWISTIMRNSYINELRKKKRQMTVFGYPDEALTLSSKISVENAGVSHLEMEHLYELLDTLEEKYKIPVLMHYQGYQYKEIAEKLDISLGTLKSRIHHARRRLNLLLVSQSTQ